MTDAHSTSLNEPWVRPSTASMASRFAAHCEGFFAADSPHHLLGVALKVSVVENSLRCPGSTLLDEINAFDLAEAEGANLGQLNVITVSSFCGPQGLVWGLDVCRPAGGHRRVGSATRGALSAELYDLDGLTTPFGRLVGSVESQRFPFMPGAHVPAAMKVRVSREPGRLYSALAMGVPEDRRRDACLLMENPGFLSDTEDWDRVSEEIKTSMAHSVLAVGENQRIRYPKIFVGVVSAVVKRGQTACALAMAPYFRLARSAFVPDRDLSTLTLEEWEHATRDRFLGCH